MSSDFKSLGLFLIGFLNAPMFTMKKISFTAIVLNIPILNEMGEESERAHKDLSCLQLIDWPGCNVSHNMMQLKSLSCFAPRWLGLCQCVVTLVSRELRAAHSQVKHLMSVDVLKPVL